MFPTSRCGLMARVSAAIVIGALITVKLLLLQHMDFQGVNTTCAGLGTLLAVFSKVTVTHTHSHFVF